MKATLLLVAVCTLLVGCESEIEPLVYAGRGGMSPSTRFDLFRESIDDYIQRELAGGKLGLHGEGPSWKTFWQTFYPDIRKVNDPATAEKEIGYIHQQRRRFGLPLYDPSLTTGLTRRSS